MGNQNNAGRKPGKATILRSTLRDLDRLQHLKDQLWEIQKNRIQEKYPEYGSYMNASLGDIMENLGCNLVQFTSGVANSITQGLHYNDYAAKQAGDIINLVLMAVDKAGVLK